MNLYFTLFTIIAIYSFIAVIYMASEFIRESKEKTKNLYICTHGDLQGLTMTLKHWKTRIILITGNVDDSKVIQNMTTSEFLLYCKNMHDLVINHI